MKVKVTEEFPWAPDGNHVRYVKPGEVLEGRGAEVALEMLSGEVVVAEEVEPPAPQANDGVTGPTAPQEPEVSPLPAATAEPPAPAAQEQKTSPPGFSTADIVRKKRHGR